MAPIVWYLLSRALGVLRTPWPISVWLVLSAACVVTVLIVGWVLEWRRRRLAVAALNRRYDVHEWGGAEWPLLPSFANLLHTIADQIESGKAAWSLLESAIGDPRCRLVGRRYGATRQRLDASAEQHSVWGLRKSTRLTRTRNAD